MARIGIWIDGQHEKGGQTVKGHLRERSPGHWAIILDARDPRTGARKRRWHSFAGTKRQAQVECARLISAMQKGEQTDPTRMSVTAFLERWIEHMQGQVSPRSHERYAELCRKNLAPALGGLPLAKLQPAQISAAYLKARTSGRRDGKGGLSARTVGTCTAFCTKHCGRQFCGGCSRTTRQHL
jgi:hypothetical protein